MAIDESGSVQLTSEFFGSKTFNGGKSGSGKSYGARVLIEEAVALKIPVVVIDPQDAHGNYPGFDYVAAKNIKKPEDYGKLVSATGQNIVLRTKGLGIEEQQAFVYHFLRGYRKAVRKGIQYIVIDEAHKFAPEQSNPQSRDEVRALFQENRSDGVGALAISQRPARLDKTVLSQADNLMLFRVTSAADKEALKGYLDERDDVERLKALPRGHCMLVGFDRDVVEPIAVRKATTEHTGNSPKHIKDQHGDLYNAHRRKFVRGDRNMDNVSGNDTVKNLVPSFGGATDLVKLGATVAVGTAVAGVTSAYASRMVPMSIGPVSGRTVAAAATTCVLYGGFRLSEKRMPRVGDVMKYAAAGAAVFTFGSALNDAFVAFNVTPPAVLAYALQVGTGAPMMSAEADDSGVDLNTYQQ